MVTITELRSAYAAAAANGETNEQLAATLGIKLASLQQNLTSARKGLREIGTTDEELKLIFPPLKRRTGPLKRRTGPRTSKRAEALLAMRDAVRTPREVPQDETSKSETLSEDLQTA